MSTPALVEPQKAKVKDEGVHIESMMYVNFSCYLFYSRWCVIEDLMDNVKDVDVATFDVYVLVDILIVIN